MDALEYKLSIYRYIYISIIMEANDEQSNPKAFDYYSVSYFSA